MLFVPHTFCIKIGQITQFYLNLTYDQRFYSFMNRALEQFLKNFLAVNSDLTAEEKGLK